MSKIVDFSDFLNEKKKKGLLGQYTCQERMRWKPAISQAQNFINQAITGFDEK